MKGTATLFDVWHGRAAAARMVDGVLDDVLVDPADAAPAPGTVYLARTERAMKGQGGMVVALPDGARGFLRHMSGVAPGRPLLVQVTGYAEPGKAIPVSAKTVLKGRHAIATPGAPGVNLSRRIRTPAERARLQAIVSGCVPDGGGLILRSQAEGATEAALRADIAHVLELAARLAADLAAAGDDRAPRRLLDGPDAHALARRDWPAGDVTDPEPGAFARHGVDAILDGLASPLLALPAGASAYVEPTRALVAVDVNTGPDTSPAAGLKANIALARALPRALRCRGLGGQVTIDAAPMPKKDRPQVEAALRRALDTDPVETALVGWTPLGHLELQRQRARAPLF